MSNAIPFRDFAQRSKNGMPSGWVTWSPRAGIAPDFSVDAERSRTGGGSLMISGTGNPGAYGAWRAEIDVSADTPLTFSAWYLPDHIPNHLRHVSIRLICLDANGARTLAPVYPSVCDTRDGWKRVECVVTPPESTVRVQIDLALMWSASGSVRFDDLSLESNPDVPSRRARVMTVHLQPKNTGSSAESVAAFCRLVEENAHEKPDIVCLPEGITVVGTGKTYVDVAEPLPGHTSERLGKLARTMNAYIVAGLYERVDSLVYNTSVLIDRTGRIAGTYRKTHIPREEATGGITPGDAYPVFDTDFGRIGMMICWDVHFPECARGLAAAGAEMIFLPIWGGNDTLAKARAIENHVYLISSGYNMRTFIVDPGGVVLAEATGINPVAVADIHLDATYWHDWLGDMRQRIWKERRGDIPIVDWKE